MIAFLWAQDKNGVIGNNGKLPWYLPNDLKFFKEMTVGEAVVMGRKTFDALNGRPLPNRLNIILTRDPEFQAEGVKVMHSREEVLDFAKNHDGDTFITGGAKVFMEFMDDADLLHRTLIEETFEGDTVMPEIDWEKWKMVDVKEGIVDERNKYRHQFETYKRK